MCDRLTQSARPTVAKLYQVTQEEGGVQTSVISTSVFCLSTRSIGIIAIAYNDNDFSYICRRTGNSSSWHILQRFTVPLRGTRLYYLDTCYRSYIEATVSQCTCIIYVFLQTQVHAMYSSYATVSVSVIVSSSSSAVGNPARSSVIRTKFPSLSAGASNSGSALSSLCSSCFWQHFNCLHFRYTFLPSRMPGYRRVR